MGAALRQVVPRRQAQHRLQLRRPACRERARRQGRVPLGRRARRRPARDHLRRPEARGRAVRERAEGARRRQGNAGRDLHGDGPRGADRDARLRAARRAAHRRLRRLLGRLALRQARRHGLQGADHPGRGLAPRLGGLAEDDGRRGDGGGARDRALARPAPHGRRGADDRGPRPLVARARGRRRRLPAGADGRGGSALPPLHLGHDREAEGDRAHDRGLPRRRRDDPPLRLRPEARRPTSTGARPTSAG